jgi:hypothetical protein
MLRRRRRRSSRRVVNNMRWVALIEASGPSFLGG